MCAYDSSQLLCQNSSLVIISHRFVRTTGEQMTSRKRGMLLPVLERTAAQFRRYLRLYVWSVIGFDECPAALRQICLVC